MTAAAIIALALALASVAITAVAIAVGRAKDAKAHAVEITKERADRSAETLRASKAEFERDAVKKQLEDETNRANAFEEAFHDVIANPVDDLKPGDLRSRLVRAAIKAKAAAARRGGALPAGTTEAVPQPAEARGPDAAVVHGDGLMQPD